MSQHYASVSPAVRIKQGSECDTLNNGATEGPPPCNKSKRVRQRVVGSGATAHLEHSLPAGSPGTTHLVVVLLHEAAQRQAKALVGPHAPVHGVDSPGRFIFVDLLPFAVQGHGGGWAAKPAGEAAGWGTRRAGSPAWVSESERRRGRGAPERPSPPATPLLHSHSAEPDHQFQTSSGSDYHLPFGMPARPLGTEATRSRSDDERWLPDTSFPNCSFFLLVNRALAPAPSSLLAEMFVILLVRPAQLPEAGSFEVPKIIG